MTISHAASTGVSTATGARGTTSTSVAYVGVSAGRMAVLTVCVKPSTATLPVTVTDGASKVWDRIADVTGGTGTNAADTGTSRVAKYVRIMDGTETGSVTVTASNTPSQVCGAMDVYSTTAGGWHTPISVGGADTGHGTNPSATSGTWASTLAAGDWVNVGYGTDTDATNTASAHAITQSGTTFGTVTERSRVGNSDGNDGSVFTWDAPVNSGGATSALTMSMTWAANSCGAFAAVRLREATTTTYTKTTVDAFPGTTIDTGAWDPWGGAQITQNNQIQLATTTTAGGYYGIGRLASVNLATSPVAIQLVSIGNQDLASYGAYLLNVLFSTDNEAYWVSYGRTLSFTTKVASVTTQRYTMPQLGAMQQHFAIGFSGGNLVALWSRDGTNWVTAFSMANPYGGGDTEGTPYLMVGTDSAEASTTSLQLDDYGTLSAKTPVSQTFDVRWAIRNTATQSYDIRWAIRSTVTQSFEAQWAVRNTASNTFDMRWSVRELVTATKDIQWAIRNTVTVTTDIRWAVRATATQTYDVRWAVRNLATQSYDVRWAIQELVTSAYDIRWAVRNAVQQTADVRWAIRNSVAQSFDMRWAVRQLATQAFDIRWAIKEIVTATFEALWDFQGLVGQTFDIRWAVRNTATQTFDIQWDIEASTTTVTQTFDIRWAVREQVAQAYDVRWAVRQLAAQIFDARWAIRQLVSTTVDVRWAVRGALVAVYDVRWSVRGFVLAVYTLLWDFEDAPTLPPVSADAVAYLEVFLVSTPTLDVVISPAEYTIVSKLSAS
jgi:hypothetical protein